MINLSSFKGTAASGWSGARNDRQRPESKEPINKLERKQW
jgi:hypothetical protein